MGNQDIGDPQAFLETSKKGGDLGGERGIESVEGLVEDEQLGLGDEGARDGQALALSTAELVGAFAERSARDAGKLQGGSGALAAYGARAAALDHQRLLDHLGGGESDRNWWARLPREARAMPVSSRAAAARSRRTAPVPRRWITSGSSTISAAVNRGLRLAAGCWKMSWMSRRRSGESGRPSKRISPPVGISNCVRQRARVLLPEPEAPITAKVRPRSKLKLTPARAAVAGRGGASQRGRK